MLADAGADIFRGRGMGPLAKWVDDHVFFQILRSHLPSYNLRHAEWCCEIQTSGGCRQEGSRLWYGGNSLPSGLAEEFDEDCSTSLRDLWHTSPRVTVPAVTLACKVGLGLQDLQTRARRILAERNAEKAEENMWIGRMVVAESIGELDGLIKSRAT